MGELLVHKYHQTAVKCKQVLEACVLISSAIWGVFENLCPSLRNKISAEEGGNLPRMQKKILSLQVIISLKIMGLPGKNEGKGIMVLY